MRCRAGPVQFPGWRKSRAVCLRSAPWVQWTCLVFSCKWVRFEIFECWSNVTSCCSVSMHCTLHRQRLRSVIITASSSPLKWLGRSSEPCIISFPSNVHESWSAIVNLAWFILSARFTNSYGVCVWRLIAFVKAGLCFNEYSIVLNTDWRIAGSCIINFICCFMFLCKSECLATWMWLMRIGKLAICAVFLRLNALFKRLLGGSIFTLKLQSEYTRWPQGGLHRYRYWIVLICIIQLWITSKCVITHRRRIWKKHW